MPRAYVKGLSITQEYREGRIPSFMDKVLKTESCWLWQGGKHPSGYGYFSLGLRSVGAHRASYVLFKGDQPEGKVVCHQCDVPSCVNPDHLYLDTQRNNALDCLKKGRYWSTARKSNPNLVRSPFCRKRGHPMTPQNEKLFKDGRRQCKACHRLALDKYNAKKKRSRHLEIESGHPFCGPKPHKWIGVNDWADVTCKRCLQYREVRDAG